MAGEPGVRNFDVPASRLTEALIGFALQADVSIGAAGLGGCGPRSPGVSGRLAPAVALRRLLEGTGCTYRSPRAGSFQVLPAPPQPALRALVPTGAAPALQAPPAVIDEIILTAPKLSGSANRAPYALSVVSGADLEAERSRGAGDLALQTAGLTVTNLGAGWDKIFLRGLSDGAFTGRTQATVGTYLDDYRINFDAPDPDLLLTDIEDVEVLRGPQGTLYGSGSIGGIYRIVTRKPELDRFAGSVSVSGALTRSGAPSASAEGMVNVPLMRDKIGFRVVAYDEVSGGYLDNPRLGLSNVNQTQRSGVRAALKLRLGDRWTATLSGLYQGITAADAQYTDTKSSSFVRTTALTEPRDNDFANLGLTVEGLTSWGRVTSATALLNHSLSSRYDATASLPAFGAPTSTTAGVFDSTEHKETLVEEVDLAALPGRRLQWLAGLFLATGDEQLTSGIAALPSQARLYRELRKDGLKEGALYGELTYGLTSKIKLTAGLRAFDFRRTTRSTVQGSGAPAAGVGEADSQGVAPKLVAEYAASSSVLVYVQLAEGYRPAGFSTEGLPGEDPPGSGPLRRFGADELWNYEAGVKASLLAARLKLQAAVYQVHWRNLQTDQILPSGLPYTVNIGDARNSGVEVEAALRVDRRLIVRANLSLNNARLNRLNPAFQAPVDEAPLPGVAKVSANASADYSVPLARGYEAVFAANVQRVGDSALTFAPQTPQQSSDYTTIRLSAGLNADRWRAGLYLDNPANAAGDTFGYGNPFSFRSSAQRTPQRPLTVGLTVSAHY